MRRRKKVTGMVEYQVEDGTATAYLATPASGEGPGVLVLHAWWGLNDFFKGLCERLASEGFVALAPDLYRGKIASTIDEAEQLTSTLNSDETTRDVVGAVEYLRGHPAVRGDALGAIGFSMGAAWALLLSSAFTPDALAAVVLFYGNHAGIERNDYAKSRAAFLGHFAPEDEWEPFDEVRQTEERMQAAGKDVTFHLYPGTGHWFFEAGRPDAYHAEAAGLAWERTVAFLHRRLDQAL